MKKTFILDTSVLLYDYECLFKFDDNEVIIPSIVLEEINKFKEESSERGYAARRILEMLEELSIISPLVQGVSLSMVGPESIYCANAIGKKTIIKVSYDIYHDKVQKKLKMDENDYAIISCALNNKGVLISRDRGMRVIARDFVEVENYRADMLRVRETYKGYKKLTVTAGDITSLYNKTLKDTYNLHPNEFLILTDIDDINHVSVGIKKREGIVPCYFDKMEKVGRKIKPLNLEQKMLMYLLLDDEVRCITSTGVSGKGKTLLAVNYALAMTMAKKFSKFLYTKPSMPVEQSEYLGYFKGGPEEKLKPHLQPLFSSIEFLYRDIIYGEEKKITLDAKIDELISDDLLAFYPLANIRGMSIFDKVVLLDEAQNTTNHMMKSLVTRATDSSKLILIGDIEQIDDKNLSKFNNGLVHLIEEGKDDYIIGHVCMDLDGGSRRGKLAEFGSKNL